MRLVSAYRHEMIRIVALLITVVAAVASSLVFYNLYSSSRVSDQEGMSVTNSTFTWPDALHNKRISSQSLLGPTTLQQEKTLESQSLLSNGLNSSNRTSIHNIPSANVYFLTDAHFNDQGWGTQGLGGVSSLNASSVDRVSISGVVTSLIEHADKNPKMIIAQGFQWGDPILKIAPRYPNIKFVVMTGLKQAPNVLSIYPEQQQAAFLLGAVAAMMSKNHVIGFVGGQDYPNIVNIADGYEQGAHYIDPDTRVISEWTFDFNNITKGKQVALDEISYGADVVLHTADTSGQGVIEAAKEIGVYALGAVADQSHLAPNTVLTSFVIDMKKTYTKAYDDMIHDRFVGKILRPGLEAGPNGTGDGIIYLAPFNSKVPEVVKSKISALTSDIMSGRIVVPERNLPIS
jgi:basic membrane protein A and related proteins